MRSEKDLHTAFSAWLKRNGYIYFHSRMDQRTSQVCGDPDYVVCKGNRVAFVELKWAKNKTSPEQNARFLQLAQAGCTVKVARSLEEAVGHIEAEFGPEEPTGAPRAPEQALSEGGESPCRRSQQETSPSSGAVKSEPETAPKLYQVSSQLGQVVVKYEGQREIYVRMATAHDRMTLPMGKR